jgi:hypothetical protein
MQSNDELSDGIMNRGDEINGSRLNLVYLCNYHNSSKRNTPYTTNYLQNHAKNNKNNVQNPQNASAAKKIKAVHC